MASVERTGVRPNKEKRQWRFSRPNGLATEGEPWPCKRRRVSSGIRSCERPYMEVWAGLQTEHGKRSEAGVALQVFTACLVKHLPYPPE